MFSMLFYAMERSATAFSWLPPDWPRLVFVQTAHSQQGTLWGCLSSWRPGRIALVSLLNVGCYLRGAGVKVQARVEGRDRSAFSGRLAWTPVRSTDVVVSAFEMRKAFVL